VSPLKSKIPSKDMLGKPTNTPITHLDLKIFTHHATRHNTPIQNILSTAPKLSISQKALETLPEDVNVMSKHVGDTIRN
jgi:hypothetical protein